jgi:hypothetical protein
MRNMRISFVISMMAILLSGCNTQVQNTPVIVVVTPTPISIIVTATPEPSPTPDLNVKGWETPPSEVLLIFDPATPHPQFPPAAKFTETVAKRKFQFPNPFGFKFRDTSYSSIMENKEKNIMISLVLFEHKGKANTADFISIVLDGKMYKATGQPTEYNLSGYKGWIVDIESPAIYDNGIGQLIMVDIDYSNLFYAIGLAKRNHWESNGKQIFMDVIDKVTFPGFK